MKTKLYAGLAALFLSGLVIGYIAGQLAVRREVRRLLERGPAPLERLLAERLEQRLSLTPEQAAAVRLRVAAMVREMEAARRAEGEAIQARMRRLLTEIRPLLDAGRQARLDAMSVDDLRPGPPPGLFPGPPPGHGPEGGPPPPPPPGWK